MTVLVPSFLADVGRSRADSEQIPALRRRRDPIGGLPRDLPEARLRRALAAGLDHLCPARLRRPRGAQAPSGVRLLAAYSAYTRPADLATERVGYPGQRPSPTHFTEA